MSCARVAPVKRLCVNAAELPHAQRKIAVGSFDNDMVVIVHQAVSMTCPIIPVIYFTKYVQKRFPVDIIPENRFFVPAAGYVINSAWIFDA